MAGGHGGGNMRGPGDAGFGGFMGPQGGSSQPYAPTEFEGRAPKIPPPEWTVHGRLKWSLFRVINNPVEGESTGYVFRDTWSSATFDLRPDLLSKIGNTKQGFPIWNKGARLRVALYGPNGASLQQDLNLSVSATEFAAVFNADLRAGAGGVVGSTASPNLVRLSAADVTSLFFPTALPGFPGFGNALAGFSPRGSELGGGDGYPVRYWRLTLTFDSFVPVNIDALAPEPAAALIPTDLVLDAGLY